MHGISFYRTFDDFFFETWKNYDLHINGRREEDASFLKSFPEAGEKGWCGRNEVTSASKVWWEFEVFARSTTPNAKSDFYMEVALLQLQISAVSTSTGINNWANFRLGVQRGAKKSCMFELPDPVVLSRGQRKSSKRPCCNCNLFPNILAFILLSTWPVQCSSPPLLPTSEQSNSPLSPRIPDLVITNLVTAQF